METPHPFLAVATTLALLLSCADDTTPEKRRPPVVLVVADTLRADHLGAYGYDRETSPAIDALAAEGVLFEQCLAQSSWTKPTTASILTGRYPSEHGANHVSSIMNPDVETLAEHLHAAGYRTGAFVANGIVVGGPVGFDRGFERFELLLHEERGYARGAEVVDAALAWLDGIGEEEPFFLYVHAMDPHAPYDPPETYGARFTGGYSGERDGHSLLDPDLDPGDFTDEDWEHMRALYDGEIAYLDDQLGRLFDGLRSTGRYDEALVLLVADHGEEFGDHGGGQHNANMYQEVLRVPMIARFPDSMKAVGAGAGTRVRDLVFQIDLLPTVLDVTGIEPPTGLPGTSLLGLLGGNTSSRPGFSEVDRGGHVRRVLLRDGKKYVRSWAPDVGERLHDLAADPGELRDLAPESPPELAELRKHLDEHVRSLAEGFSLVFSNQGPELLKVTFLLTTERRPVERVTFLDAEETLMSRPEDGIDGPLQWELVSKWGGSRYLTRYRMRTAPGDVDGLSFTPDPGERTVSLAVSIGGVLIGPETFFLGPEGTHPEALPYRLDPADDGLLADGSSEVRRGSELPHAAFLWKNLGTSTARTELSDEEIANLEALGYAAED